MPKIDPLPDHLQKLVETMAANADNNREYRTALATMQAHAIVATVKATNGLKRATWLLAAITLVLAFATVSVK